jgi:hypothetical protein
MHKGVFQEEYYSVPIDNTIIVLAKKHRTNGCTAEHIRTIHKYYLSAPVDKNLNGFLYYCLSCWQLAYNTDSPCSYDYLHLVYCLHV